MYFMFLRFRGTTEKVLWRILNLSLTTQTGINLYIKTRSDWHIYNEIFVRGDYDFAIELALKQIKPQHKTINLFDLGANVGFFTLHFIDVLAKKNNGLKCKGVSVEGSLPVFRDLKRRWVKIPKFENDIQLVYGLVGKKEGSAKIFESDNSMTNSITSGSPVRKKISGRTVSYVDLNNFFQNDNTIDLLKCDIEGAEQEFLENYINLLLKVNVCVFELHHKKCDTNKCIQLIEESGMNKRKTIFNYYGNTSLEVFWRE